MRKYKDQILKISALKDYQVYRLFNMVLIELELE